MAVQGSYVQAIAEANTYRDRTGGKVKKGLLPVRGRACGRSGEKRLALPVHLKVSVEPRCNTVNFRVPVRNHRKGPRKFQIRNGSVKRVKLPYSALVCDDAGAFKYCDDGLLAHVGSSNLAHRFHL